jgi:hypothetical protein
VQETAPEPRLKVSIALAAVQSLAGVALGRPAGWALRRLPRPRPWQWLLALALSPFLFLWLLVAAMSSSMDSATVLVTRSSHGIADPNSFFDFGDLPRTAGIEHQLVLKNEGKVNTLVAVVVTGEISDFVTVEDSLFSLKPGEEREILMALKVPNTAEIDKRYNGRAFVVRMPWWAPF